MLSIDLHGMSVKDATIAVHNTFRIAIEQGHNEIYIVTGYGSHVNANGSAGVLKKILPSLLKPFEDLIIKTEKETAAYKITLKRIPTEQHKSFERFFQTELYKLVERHMELEARSGNVDSKLALAAFHLSSFSKEDNKIAGAVKVIEAEEQNGSAQAGIMLAEILLEGSKIPRDPKRAKKILEKYADKNQDAKYMLAKTVLQGEGTIRDDNRGKKLMLELAKTGHAAACCTVGQSYLSGDYTEKNDLLGVQFLKQAADQNYPYAFVDLARCYGAGQGTTQNDKLALDYYDKAAKLNNPYAIYQLGRYHMIGKGVPVNRKTAFQYFLKAAQLEDGDAQGMVAIFYFLGLDMKPNKADALKWLKRAADKNHPEACYLLGSLLIEGQFIDPNAAEGLKYLRIAAKEQYPLAMLSVAIIILSGKYTEEEKKHAFALLKTSCTLELSLDPTGATGILVKKSYYMAGIFFEIPKMICAETGEKDPFPVGLLSLAMEYIKQNNISLALLLATYSAGLGHTDSEWFLMRAYLFEKHQGVTAQDEIKGFGYLQKLVAKKEPEALYILAIAYIEGQFGLSKDTRQAMPIMVQAAEKGWPEAIRFLQLFQRHTAKKENNLQRSEPTSIPVQPTNVSSASNSTKTPLLSSYGFAAAAVGAVGIASALIYKYYKP